MLSQKFLNQLTLLFLSLLAGSGFLFGSLGCTKKGAANKEVSSLNYGLAFGILEGNNQAAIPGRLFSQRLKVQVTNLLAQPVQGMTVKFSVISGNNFYLTGSEVLTDANGIAFVEARGPEDYNMTGKIKAELLGTTHSQIFTIYTNDKIPGVRFEIESTLGQEITAGRPFGFIVKLVNSDGALVDYTGTMQTIWQIFSGPSWMGRVPQKLPTSFQCQFIQGECRTPTTGPQSVILYDSREPAVVYMGDGNSGYQDVFAYEINILRDSPHGLVIADGLGGPAAERSVVGDRTDITTDSAPLTLAGAVVDAAGNYISDAGPMVWSSDRTEIATSFSATTGETITFSPDTTIAYQPTDPLFTVEVPFGKITAQQQGGSPAFTAASTGKVYVSPGVVDHFEIDTDEGTTTFTAGMPYRLRVKAVDAKGNIVGKSIQGAGYDGTRILQLKADNDGTYKYASPPRPIGGGWPWFGPPGGLIDDGLGNLIVGSQDTGIVNNSAFTERFFYGVSTKTQENRLIFFDATDVNPRLTISTEALAPFPAITGSQPITVVVGPPHHLNLRKGSGPDGDPVCVIQGIKYSQFNIKTLLLTNFSSNTKADCGGKDTNSNGIMEFTAGKTDEPVLYYAVEDIAGNLIANVNGKYFTTANLYMTTTNNFRNSFTPAAGTTPSPTLTYTGAYAGEGLMEIQATYTDPVTLTSYPFVSYISGEVTPAIFDHFEVHFTQLGRNGDKWLPANTPLWTDRGFAMTLDAYDQFNNLLIGDNAFGANGRSIGLSVNIPSNNLSGAPEGSQTLNLPALNSSTTLTLGVPSYNKSNIYLYDGWIPNVQTGPVTLTFTDASKPSNNRTVVINPVAGPLTQIDLRTDPNDAATTQRWKAIEVTADETKIFYLVGKDAFGNISNTPLGTWTLPNLTPNSLEYNATGSTSIFNVLKPGSADQLIVDYTFDDGTTVTSMNVQTGSVTLKAGKFARMRFDIPQNIVAGVSFDVVATLVDQKGNALTHINGQQDLIIRAIDSTPTLLGLIPKLPADGPYNFTNGSVTLPFTFYNSLNLGARIQINTTIEGEPGVGTSKAGDLIVQNAALDHLHILKAVPSIFAGDTLTSNFDSTTLDIYAEDQWGNPMKTGTGSNLIVRVQLNSSSLTNQDIVSTTLNNPTTSTSGTNDTLLEGTLSQGHGTFTVQSTTAGTMTFLATAIGNGTTSGTNTLDSLLILPLPTIMGIQWALAQQPLANHNASGISPIGSALGALGVQILDSYGNVITTNNLATMTATIQSGTQPFFGGTTNKAVQAGTALFNDLKYTKAENIILRVTLDQDPALYVEAPIQVWPNGVRQTIVLMPGQTFTEGSGLASTAITGTPFAGGISSIAAGSSFNVTVRLVDSAFNTILDNTQIAALETLNLTDPYVTVTPPSGGTLTNGVGTFNVTVKRQGAHQFVAKPVQVTQISQLAGTSYTVTPLAATRLVALLPGQELSEGAPNITSALSGTPPAVVAGTPFNVRLIATDAWFNQRADVNSGNVTLSTTDPRDNNSIPEQGLVGGITTFSVTNFTAATGQKITPTGTGAGAYTIHDSSLYAINAAPATQCMLVYSSQTHIPGFTSYASALTGSAPSNLPACTGFTVTAKAIDPYFNTDTTYTGAVSLTTPDDPTDTEPTASNFSAGLKNFTINPVTASSNHGINLSCGSLTVNTPALHTISKGAKALLVPYFPDYQSFDSSRGHQTLTSAIPDQSVPDFTAGDTNKITVVATDACYNIISDENAVSVSLTSTGTNFSFGTATSLVNGQATFNNVRNFRSGSGYVIKATDSPDGTYSTKKDSTAYNILSGPAAKLLAVLPNEVFNWGKATASEAAQGTPFKQTANYPYQVTVYATDAYYNKISGDSQSTVTIDPSQGGGFSISSTAEPTLSNGSATFTINSSSPLASLQIIPRVVTPDSGRTYVGENSDPFEVLAGFGDPTLQLQDATTGNQNFVRQVGTQSIITNGSTIKKWCLSESQSSRPVTAALSNNKGTCAGTSGTIGLARDGDGWYIPTSAPTSFNVSGTANGKTVYLWVADDANNVSLNAVSDTITLDLGDPATPTLTIPVGSHSSSSTPAITVDGATDAVAYCLIEQTNSTASQPAFNNTCWTSTIPTQVTLTQEGSRNVFLFTKDAADRVSQTGASAQKTVFYDPTPPGSFSITGVWGNTDLAPDGYLGTTTTPSVTWSGASDTTDLIYTVVIKSGTSAVAGCTLNSLANATSLTLSGCTLTHNQSYTVEVTAKDQANNTKAATAYGFVVDNVAPGSFNFTGVTGGTDTTADAILSNGNTVTLNWVDSSEETNYKVTIFNSDGATVKCAQQTLSADVTSYSFSSCPLDYANLYYARVEAWDAAGNITLASGGNQAFTVKPQAHHYEISLTAPGAQTAGESIGVTVTAKLSNNTTDTSFVGTQTVTFSTDGGVGNEATCASLLSAMSFEAPTTAQFIAGVATINSGIKLKKAETGRKISVSSNIAGVSLQGDSTTFDVLPNIHVCNRFLDSNLSTGNDLTTNPQYMNLGDTLTVYSVSYDYYGNFIGNYPIEWDGGTTNFKYTPNPRYGSSTTIKAVEKGIGATITPAGKTTPKITINVNAGGSLTWDATTTYNLSGHTLIGGNQILKTYYYEAGNDSTKINGVPWYKVSGYTPSWYTENASSVRGDRAEFPARTFLVATNAGLDIIDVTTNKLWMRFEANSKFPINTDLGSITDVVALEGKIFVAMAQSATNTGGLIIIDLINDQMFQITNFTKILYYSGSIQTIINRNKTSTLTSNTSFPNFGSSSPERILSLAALRVNNSVDYIAIGTQSSALLFTPNTATPTLYKATSAPAITGPINKVALAAGSVTDSFRYYFSESNSGLHRVYLVPPIASTFATYKYTTATNARLPSLNIQALSFAKNIFAGTPNQNQIFVGTDMGLTVINENATLTSSTAKTYNYQGSGSLNPVSWPAPFGTGFLQSLGVSGSYAEIASAGGITNTATIDLLFRPQSDLTSSSASMPLLSKGTVATSGSFGISFNRNNDGKISLWINDGGTIKEVGTNKTTWDQGTWYHIAAVFKPTALDIFVDGALSATTPITLGSTFGNSSTLRLMGDGTTGAAGALDNVRISNTDLYLGAGFTLQTTAYSSVASTVYLLPFNEATGTTSAATKPAATNVNLLGSGSLWLSAPLYKGKDQSILQITGDDNAATSSAQVITASAWSEINSLHSTPAITDSTILSPSFVGRDVFYFHNSAIVDKDIVIIQNDGTRDQLLLKIR